MTRTPTDPDATAVADLAHELGVLKRVRRAGWWQVGVRDPESVAEHSLRVAQLAGLIAAEEGADPARAAYLGLWHDSQETRTTDLPHSARPYVARTAGNEAVTRDQVARLPEAAARTVTGAVAEYEERTTPEARCAKDADLLECLLQALEYRAAGYQHVQPWIDSSRAGLTTAFARRVADAALAGSTLGWHEQARRTQP
ncbi:HD family hydrolase [Promicromonospora citrea]|uniref:5'-deoxynucleotidase n=1 Tax=Promicromonospora citrea TaxID=43677 RepID=A0A8H9GLU7_9MICO|nr:HD domain-containing protein [Promicromonospora citrea]NNH54308.1 HD domain-containing protein [Promicromonospora citrea]GGM38215.1 haloacid dehalogenase [Promicromonospora citrea]